MWRGRCLYNAALKLCRLDTGIVAPSSIRLECTWLPPRVALEKSRLITFVIAPATMYQQYETWRPENRCSILAGSWERFIWTRAAEGAVLLATYRADSREGAT